MQTKHKILFGFWILALAGTGIYFYRRNKNKAESKAGSEKSIADTTNNTPPHSSNINSLTRAKLINDRLTLQATARITGKVWSREELNRLTEPELRNL